MTTEQIQPKTKQISSYFNEVSEKFLIEYEDKGLKKHTQFILSFFEEQDISKDTVLELGCGIGGLLLEFLKMGVKHAYGIDLSEEMIHNAKTLFQSKGYDQQADFQIGDFGVDARTLFSFEQADIVIADRVLCCSPVPLEILGRILDYQPKFIVLVQPRKNWVARAIMFLRFRLRQRSWGVKHHGVEIPFAPVKEYDALTSTHGYHRVLQRFRYGWEVIIYQKKS